jgi:hypothetical protein
MRVVIVLVTSSMSAWRGEETTVRLYRWRS